MPGEKAQSLAVPAGGEAGDGLNPDSYRGSRHPMEQKSSRALSVSMVSQAPALGGWSSDFL